MAAGENKAQVKPLEVVRDRVLIKRSIRYRAEMYGFGWRDPAPVEPDRPAPPSEIETFLARVDKDGPVIRPELGSCWLWLYVATGEPYVGYGAAHHLGKTITAHRLSWILHRGPIPPETPWVLHKCDNPPCVNPGHLFLGTSRDNVADKVAKGRQARGEKHGLAKLTNAQAREAWRLLRAGHITKDRLATLMGVSIMTVHSLTSGISWKWLDEEAERPA